VLLARYGDKLAEQRHEGVECGVRRGTKHGVTKHGLMHI